MSAQTRQRVSLLDLGKGALGILPDFPLLAREAPGLLLRKPTAKNSLGLIFQKNAARHPERPFVKGEGDDGNIRTLTYGEANSIVNRYAHVLQSRGVHRGDVVGLMAHNGIDNLLVMLATVKLGAISGLLNYNQRSDVLAHSLGILGARVVVVEDSCTDGFATAGDTARSQQLLTFTELREAAASQADDNPAACEQIVAHEKAFYIFTSGTTGMPKASVMSHFRWLKSYSGLGALGVRLKSTDTMYCPLPLYHNNAVTVALGAVLVSGASMAIAPKFTATRFWDECIRYDATAFVYIGELCRYLLAQPEKPVDRQHKVRVIVGNGLRPDIWDDFQGRFDIERIAEFYGASECNIAFINAYNLDQTAGTCPLPYKVVAYDIETGAAVRNGKGRLTKVKKGEVGLLLAKVTDRAPFDGYTDDDATEAKLLRGGFKDGDVWFNTGDLVRDQGFTHVAFVDRLGDTFRWKGENVATTEVEGAIDELPSVDDVTVYGVAVPGTDGKAGMAAVVLREGASFDGPAVFEHLATSLPSYAMPLFIRITDSLEHTSTFKSRKIELRNQSFERPGEDTVYALTDAAGGYVPYYEGYAQDVVSGKYPRV
ncbi:long-chain-acyl-CoA synthetase [Flexivirga endophytica]|uniref:Long-chain-acyl-CoA synthetase n=1 Tax=Flexivirga endophytica TaxID=1849103 RepID=A0A916SZQ6_9MICO|nr:long-chain-acyl-CoA synthetase [Flexivirga endophytica]GGB24816.1 long-chain-acyl-CoA synthetase [Flexivirga endophytica]GHB63531.1 long-chain-acyl-CoA synthetase [Flexivirga endophytica]